jgi:hypothetical protein
VCTEVHVLLQVTHVQAPPTHVYPFAHALPQPPQFASSLFESEQTPAQH